jgi:hypothetical protein
MAVVCDEITLVMGHWHHAGAQNIKILLVDETPATECLRRMTTIMMTIIIISTLTHSKLRFKEGLAGHGRALVR